MAQELLSQSEAALAAHEEMMMSLLCTDCVIFNTQVYGASVFFWPWDQFSGPCACRGAHGEHATRIAKFNECIGSLQSFPPVKAPSEDRPNLQFPPSYLDAHYILESHLSRQARRLSRLAYKDEISFSKRTASIDTSRYNSASFQETLSPESQKACLRTRCFLRVRTIWDLVTVVAREQYACQVFEGVAAPSTPSAPQGNESPYSDSILEINAFQRQSFLTAASHKGAGSHLIAANPNLNAVAPGRISGLQALYFPSGSKRAHNIYLSPLHQDEAVILARGLRYTPRSQSIETQIQSTSSAQQVLSSEESHATGSGYCTDEWASRTLLRRARRELGLDTDLIALHAAIQAESMVGQSESNSDLNAGHLARSQITDEEQGEDQEVERDGSERTMTASEATATTFAGASTSSLDLPMSSNPLSKLSGSWAIELSALSTAILLTLIGHGSATTPTASLATAGVPNLAHPHLEDGSGSDPHHSGESSSSSTAATTASSVQASRLNPSNSVALLIALAPSVSQVLAHMTGSMYQQASVAFDKLEVCISLALVVPLALAQVAMKVVCFYSKSCGTFRLV